MAKLKYLFLPFLILASCKLEIESSYEDADGFYLEYINTYPISGNRFIFFTEDTVITNDGHDIYFYNIHFRAGDIGYYGFDNRVVDFALLDKHVIATLDDSTIKVLDISNLQSLQVRDSLKLCGVGYSIILKENTAFILSNDKIFLIDCEDKDNLSPIKILQFGSELVSFTMDSTKLYVNTGEKCIIFDIKNIPNCYPCDSFVLSSNPCMIIVNKNSLYAAARGLDVYDLINKQQKWTLNFPEPLIISIYIFNKFGIAITWYSGETYLINLEYPSKPAVLEQIESRGSYCYGIIRNNKIYLLSENGLSAFVIKEIK
ncbi:MAG: hypothetical protein OEZ20_03975 [candidate division WOR-3 bacterium]|nr:hypothetical protein [candidate division WOR-3 bacterium]MDH5683604.1 hypothetical protein [candidate division WOR-3 bacterium]